MKFERWKMKVECWTWLSLQNELTVEKHLRTSIPVKDIFTTFKCQIIWIRMNSIISESWKYKILWHWSTQLFSGTICHILIWNWQSRLLALNSEKWRTIFWSTLSIGHWKVTTLSSSSVLKYLKLSTFRYHGFHCGDSYGLALESCQTFPTRNEVFGRRSPSSN